MKKFIPWIILGIVFVVVFIISPIDKLQIAGQNMTPTYKDKQIVWLNKTAFWFGKPSRGDVILFVENRATAYFERINRIIAIPGDTIKIQNGAVYLNNKILEEPYVQGKTEISDSSVFAEGKDYILKDNEYFVLGDNRVNSKYDSRSIGMINAHIKDSSKIRTFIEGKIF